MTIQENEIKLLRNKVIGNPFEKKKYVNNGTFDSFLNNLQSINNELVLQHTLIFLSSCLLLPEAKVTPDHTNLVWTLFVNSSTTETKIAAAKCLRSIYESNTYPVATDHVKHIVNLLSTDVVGPKFKLSLVLCELLSKICKSKPLQTVVTNSGGIDKLIMLINSDNPKLVSSCLLALSCVLKENLEICKHVLSLNLSIQNKETGLLPLLLHFVKTMKQANDKLIVCSCIVNLYLVQPSITKEIHLVVLPTLVKLLPNPKAALVLAYLTAGSEEFQKGAAEMESIPKLAQVVKEWETTDIIVLEACLTALAAISSLREDCRRKVIDAKVLLYINKLLNHPNPKIRSSACQLTRSLSRSVKTLRTALVDASIVQSILKLLSDSDDDVKVSACATLCNIVLDFSPVKEEVTANNGIQLLVSLVDSSHLKLRLNSIWALKNLVYQSKSELKQRVMRELSWQRLSNLLNDDQQIQEHALNLIRNLACMEENDIEDVFKGLGSFIQILESKMRNVQTPVLLQALYVVVNVATGNENHKSAILSSEILIEALYNYIDHVEASIRVAAVWAIINLTWQEDESSYDRTTKLKGFGFQEKLVAHLQDSDADVRGRVKTAIEHFEATMSM